MVAFPVQRIRAVTGRLLIDGPVPLVPAFGQLTVTAEGRHVDSPIGRDGEFYLDSVQAGHHQALIEHDGGQCRFVLEVPQADAAILDLGALRCVPASTP